MQIRIEIQKCKCKYKYILKYRSAKPVRGRTAGMHFLEKLFPARWTGNLISIKTTLIHYMHAIASKKYKKYNKSQEIQVRCTQPKGISGRAAECSLQLQARNTRNTTTIAKKQKVQCIQLKGS